MRDELSYPNSLIRKDIYEEHRNLISEINYALSEQNNPVNKYNYEYNTLSLPTSRNEYWEEGEPRKSHRFSYNDRRELIEDQWIENYESYHYDNRGNRKESQSSHVNRSYGTNELNQYTNIQSSTPLNFVPAFDRDGNQTFVETSTGIWHTSYNANNRPVVFTSNDGLQEIKYIYDFAGRMLSRAVYRNGVLQDKKAFVYKGYQQIAELDVTGPESYIAKSYFWDPTQKMSTRVLLMSAWNAEVAEHLYFAHDIVKNTTALFDAQGNRKAFYEYLPFGDIIDKDGEWASADPFRFSSEYYDDELGLICYSYRCLNPVDGRWMSRDLQGEQGGLNLYGFVDNGPVYQTDYLGQWSLQGILDSLVQAVNSLVDTLKESLMNVGSSVISEITGKLKSWNDRANLRGQWSQDIRTKRKFPLLTLQGGVGYRISADNCCVSVGGRGFMQLEAKSPKFFLVLNFVGRGAATIEARYKFCLADREDRGFDGTFKFSLSGGVQAGLDAYAANVTVELGIGISWSYSFKSEEWSDPSVSVYLRAYAEVDIGIWSKRREVRFSYGGDVDVY